MIYVVLGMHKSGTTLVSQILHHSGINMGDEIDPQVSYDRGNKYERLSTRAINMEILGLDSTFTPCIDLDTSRGLVASADQRARMRDMIQRSSETYPNWGFKDPRTCLTYPLWAAELPEHKLIAVFRPIVEVWPRYRSRSIYRSYQNPAKAWEFVRGWCKHNLNVLDFLQQSSMDWVALSYHNLLNANEDWARLQQFVSLELSDQRRQDLYRSQPTNYPILKVVTWLVKKQCDYDPDQIMAQFEALRGRV